MNKNEVIFETKVLPREGSPYLASKRNVRFLMTQNEICLIDPRWEYVIPFCQIYSCISKPLKDKKVIAATFSAPSTVEFINNFIIIDFVNEDNRRTLLRLAITKHYMIKSNVPESIRFNETVEKYRLRDKFRKDTAPENGK